MNSDGRQPITLSQALGVLAFGYATVVALAILSDVAITAQFATNLALSQGASLIAYTLFRGWYDTAAA